MSGQQWLDGGTTQGLASSCLGHGGPPVWTHVAAEDRRLANHNPNFFNSHFDAACRVSPTWPTGSRGGTPARRLRGLAATEYYSWP